MTMWMLRSQAGALLPSFLEKSIVGLGWKEIGNLENKTRDAIKRALLDAYPNSYKAVPIWASILENFVHGIRRGDLVVTYDTAARIYRIAEVTGDYQFIKTNKETPNIRKVKWFNKSISRDLLSVTAKNSLGSTLTLFKLSKEIEQEFVKLLSEKKVVEKTGLEKEQETKQISDELWENSQELLKEKILGLSPDDMEDFIKELLNAMGYIARRTKKGSDGGMDVFAVWDWKSPEYLPK